VVRAVYNEWPEHEHGKRQLERMLPNFSETMMDACCTKDVCVFREIRY
jgi:hypothetical protein